MLTRIFFVQVLTFILACSGPGLANNGLPVVPARRLYSTDTHCTVRQLVLEIFRNSGSHVLFADNVVDETITRPPNGVSANAVLEKLARTCELSFEQIGTDTIYVTHAPPAVPPVTEAAPASTPSAEELTLDEALSRPVAPPPERADRTTNAQPVVLKGNLEHRSQMEPVDKRLRVGAKVDITKLRALTPGNVWARVPNWAGGTWKTKSMTAYYRYNYIHNTKNLLVDSFMNKGAETFGWQRDRNGDIWHRVLTEFYTVVEGETEFDVDLHSEHEVVEQDDQHFLVRHVATRAIVDKQTLRVRRVTQCEALNYYTRLSADVLRCKSSIKEFAEDGKPASLQKAVSYETRSSGYSDWNVYRGRAMRPLFMEYLSTHGLSHLTPIHAAND
jgi:hypothetical protein